MCKVTGKSILLTYRDLMESGIFFSALARKAYKRRREV
jgi:hypothetical protein